jgi:subtilase family serine protease
VRRSGGVLALAAFAAGALLLAVVAGAPAAPAASPDLVLALSSTRAAWPRNEVTVTVTVKNVGAAAAPASSCRMLIKNARPPRQTVRTVKKSVRALAAGDEFAFSFSVRLGPGVFEVVANADPKKRIRESDETNNTARLMIAAK